MRVRARSRARAASEVVDRASTESEAARRDEVGEVDVDGAVPPLAPRHKC